MCSGRPKRTSGPHARNAELRNLVDEPVYQTCIHHQFSKVLRSYYCDPTIGGLGFTGVEDVKHSRILILEFVDVLRKFRRCRFGFHLNESPFTGTWQLKIEIERLLGLSHDAQPTPSAVGKHK